MIKPEEYNEAYRILLYCISNISIIEQALRRGAYIDCTSLGYIDSTVQYISPYGFSGEGKLKLCNEMGFSFIRGMMHRKADVNLHFSYSTDSEVQIDGSNDNFDFSEEQLFQLGLVLEDEIMQDLEFLCYLKKKKFPYNFSLFRNAFNIDGLRSIKKHVEDCLCQILVQK